MIQRRPFGTWRSPISASDVAGEQLRLTSVAAADGLIYWLEGRPSEDGRVVLVCRRLDGSIVDLTPPPFNVRSRVHEYGGGAWALGGDAIYFSNFRDGRLYRINVEPSRDTLREPTPITPDGAWRYADIVVDVQGRRLICVREDHTRQQQEPINALVAIPLDGAASEGVILASGHDFYSTPRLSPDRSRLCWLAWRHPHMPWDATELWVADMAGDGTIADARCVAGGDAESIYQPGWSPDGRLCFVSDRDGWWRLYRSNRSNRSDRSDRSDRWNRSDEFDVVPVVSSPPADAEFGRPQWVFGTATWAFADPGRIVVAYTQRGRWRLATVEVATGALSRPFGTLEPHDWLTATPTHAVVVAGSSTMCDAVVQVDLTTGDGDVLQRSSTVEVDPSAISLAEPIEFPTGSNGLIAHAFYYAPVGGISENSADPSPERPPLLVIGHGGPTTAAMATLDLRIQFWTSRGFAVVDVDYSGSSGYGRPYRERLNGRWGVADVADVVNAARYLVARGDADADRLIVRGGSAGGYTTLAALTFQPDVFKAGASYYGISDLEVLARDTHKFESRYLDALIGPYPAMRDVYRARSPIHYVDRLSCALILFQGLEDAVVPPSQSEMMANAVRAKGWPVAYLTFEGEQHGFRRAASVVRSLEAELFFYGAVFGFTPADPLPAIHIDNLTKPA